VVNSRIIGSGEPVEAAEDLLSGDSATSDRSLSDLLRTSRQPPGVKQWAAAQLEGFNAARQERIGVAGLKKDAAAAERIDGDLAFRLPKGYDALPLLLLHQLPQPWDVVQLNQIVETVIWQPGDVRVQLRSAVDGATSSLRCGGLLTCVPLAVLQAEPGSGGTIRFDPVIPNLKAAAKLEVGHVSRVIFRFDEVFWNDDSRLKDAGLIVSQESIFPTWWTLYPVIAPLLTGWSGGTAGDAVRGLPRQDLIAAASGSLSRILNRKLPRIVEAYTFDWNADPFYRGAYSYVPVDGLRARKALSRPVEDTLFFAGEATDDRGYGGTVHGAIASGRRAAHQILQRRAS
jgi:monoamine oxidase